MNQAKLTDFERSQLIIKLKSYRKVVVRAMALWVMNLVVTALIFVRFYWLLELPIVWLILIVNVVFTIYVVRLIAMAIKLSRLINIKLQ